MRTAAFALLTLLACESNESDEVKRRPPTQTFPGGMTAASGATNSGASGSGSSASGGVGGAGGAGGSGASSTTSGPSPIPPICTCVWNITHDDVAACTDCKTLELADSCQNALNECDADGLCNQLITTVLENCPGEPNLACIEQGLGFPSTSRTLAENLLVCLCGQCGPECSVNPQCQ